MYAIFIVVAENKSTYRNIYIYIGIFILHRTERRIIINRERKNEN